jgi:DNA-binding LacI/PurR family transcriptional regulator
VEGAIVVSPTHVMQDVSFIQKIIDGGFPLVFIDRVTGVEGSYVQVDRYKGGKMAAEHLANLGHESVLYLKTSDTNFREQDRFSGFIDAWKTAGHGRSSVKVIENSGKSAQTMESIKDVLSQKDRPTALFGYDEHVLMAINVARGMGFHVPDDLAVVGFDNLNLTEDFDPPLTTVDYPKSKIGEHAFNVLMRLIQDPKHSPIQQSVEPFLVVRESCGATRRNQADK